MARTLIFITFPLCVCSVIATVTTRSPTPSPTRQPVKYKPGESGVHYPSPPPPPASPRPTPHPVYDRDERRFPRTNKTRLRRGFVQCPCSMSSRGFARGRVLPNGTETMLKLNENWDDGHAARRARKLYDECSYEHGHEACVNWDAASVFDGKISLCLGDKLTNRNVFDYGDGMLRTLGRCDERDYTKSLVSSLRNGQLLQKGEGGKNGEATGLMKIFEGCVAIEHLRNVRFLQHPIHFLRPVLCANGFCATPNHAIVVDGEWTSMARLCNSRWRCAKQTKLVNNLSVFDRTRLAAGGGIIITPYDVRISILATWMLQVIEHGIVIAMGLASIRALTQISQSLPLVIV